jgi:hypothetical protein
MHFEKKRNLALFLLDLNLYQNTNLMPVKKSILILLPIVLLIMFSQIECSVSPCESVPNPSIKQTNWKLIAIDDCGKAPVPVSANKAPLLSFGLGIIYDSTPDAGNQAGFDCGFKPDISSGRVTKILITCLQDFDPSHPAGVSLNDHFRVRERTNPPSYNSIVIDVFNVYSYPMREVDLVMVQPPDHPGDYQFHVNLYLDQTYKSDTTYSTPVITLY